MATFPFPGTALIKSGKVGKVPSKLIMGSSQQSCYWAPRHFPVSSVEPLNTLQGQFTLFLLNFEGGRGPAEASVFAQMVVPGILIPHMGYVPK